MNEQHEKRGLGPKGICKCPKCDYQTKHEPGKPCRDFICPKCNVVLIRESSFEDK